MKLRDLVEYVPARAAEAALGILPLGPADHFGLVAGSGRYADVMGVDTIIVARTDALGANLVTSDVDERDREFLTGALRSGRSGSSSRVSTDQGDPASQYRQGTGPGTFGRPRLQ